MKIVNSNIVTAFDAVTVGTKVTDPSAFRALVNAAVEAFAFPEKDIPERGVVKGQAFIMLPDAALATVSAGVGERTSDPEDYIARLHRGEVGLFLKRERAAKATGAAVVVYTREAYLRDPQVSADAAEVARVEATDATHILVAVLAFAGPKAPLSPRRFVANLAGGNLNAQGLDGDAIRAQAAEVDAYATAWETVAD